MGKTVLLQPSEWIIMEKLWENHPKTVVQLFHELEEEPGWSKSTVNTLLGRMVKKEIIYFEEGRKAKQYYPKVSRDEAAAAETGRLIDRIYKGSVSLMMNTLLRSRNLSRQDIRELYEILGKEAERDV